MCYTITPRLKLGSLLHYEQQNSLRDTIRSIQTWSNLEIYICQIAYAGNRTTRDEDRLPSNASSLRLTNIIYITTFFLKHGWLKIKSKQKK